MDLVPDLAKTAVLQKSIEMAAGTAIVRGYDWNRGINYDEILKSYRHSGFQASNFGIAVEEINKMLEVRDVPLDGDQQDSYEEDEFIRRKSRCTIFFGYTTSSGLRETIKFLVQYQLVDCIVTTSSK